VGSSLRQLTPKLKKNKTKMPSPVAMTRSSPSRVIQAALFDRAVKAHQRGRPMEMNRISLHKLLAKQMLERREFIRQETPVVLEIGSHCGWYLHHLCQHPEYAKQTKQYIQCEISAARLEQNAMAAERIIPDNMEFVQMQCDEEVSIPVPEKSVDMVISCLSMHWVNDLETAMINIRKVLKQDGFLLLCMFGGNTLYELRSAFTMAEMERDGGYSAHTNPMIDGAGMSTLLLQAGFHFPTIDMDRHRLEFPSMFHLTEYIQDMGENNCLQMRRPHTPRSTFIAAAACYDHMYGDRTTGKVPASFEVFHALGWAPSPNKPVQTSERGSGQISLQMLQSPEHKEFQEVLKRLGEDPENEELMAQAEKLLESLKGDGSTPKMQEEGSEGENIDHKEESDPNGSSSTGVRNRGYNPYQGS